VIDSAIDRAVELILLRATPPAEIRVILVEAKWASNPDPATPDFRQSDEFSQKILLGSFPALLRLLPDGAGNVG
jgi:hypothetical protein